MRKMIVAKANRFYARFFPTCFNWYVELDDVKIEVKDLIIMDSEENLKQNFQEVFGRDVQVVLADRFLIVVGSEKLELETIWTDLYNPDKPKNLAKVVTVQ